MSADNHLERSESVRGFAGENYDKWLADYQQWTMAHPAEGFTPEAQEVRAKYIDAAERMISFVNSVRTMNIIEPSEAAAPDLRHQREVMDGVIERGAELFARLAAPASGKDNTKRLELRPGQSATRMTLPRNEQAGIHISEGIIMNKRLTNMTADIIQERSDNVKVALREFIAKIVSAELGIEINPETPLTPEIEAKVKQVQSRQWVRDCIRDLVTTDTLDEIDANRRAAGNRINAAG